MVKNCQENCLRNLLDFCDFKEKIESLEITQLEISQF